MPTSRPQPGLSTTHGWQKRPLLVLCGLYLFVGGISSFLGWALDIRRLTDWNNSGISIQPNATVCVTLTGLALLMLQMHRRGITTALGVLVALIGGLTITQWIIGLNFGIDALLLFGREWGRVGVIVPGRMGPPGSLSWTCIGVAMVQASVPQHAPRRFVSMLALVTLAISTTSIVAYCFGASNLYTLPRLTVIAFQTATFIAAASIALIVSVPERDPMRTLLADDAAGMFARRLLPAVIAVPMMLGFFRVRFQQAGYFDTAFGTTLRTVIEIVLMTGLLFLCLRIVRRHQQALRDSEQVLRFAQRAANAGTWTWDRDSGLVTWSAECYELFGIDPNTDLLYDSWCSALHPEDRERADQAARQAMERGESLHVEYRINHPKRGERWLNSIGRIVDPANRPGFMTGLSQDITERKHAEQSIAQHAETLETALEQRTRELILANEVSRRAEAMAVLGALASGIAHDLSNLVLPMRARLDLLKDADLSDPTHRHVQTLRQNVEYMHDLSQRVRQYLRDSAHEAPSDNASVREALDLAHWCRQSEPFLKGILPSRAVNQPAITVECRAAQGIPLLPINKTGLTQAVYNLVQNSAKAMTRSYLGERIIVAVFINEQQGVSIAVIDDGPGMSAEVLARCVEPRFTTDGDTGGTGMGLSLVKAFVDSHGGEVNIYSPPPKFPAIVAQDPHQHFPRGTAVVMRFPVSESPVVTAP